MYLSILICIGGVYFDKKYQEKPYPSLESDTLQADLRFSDPCGLHHCLRPRILSEGYHTDHCNLPRLRGPDRQHDESVPDAFF